ncbi:MAG: TonB-dependent receptor, partial [Bryobacteraceae bacterium]
INVTTVLWDLPYGKGRRFGSSAHPALKAVLGGWRLAVINFAYAGMPVNLTYNPASQFQVSSAPTYRPNITGDPMMPKGQRRAERWLNPDTVQIPTDPSRPFGNAGRNIAVGPPLHQMNFGLHKDFPVRERSRVEVRMEAFNFLNKTNLGTPNSNRSSAAFGTISSLNQPAREIQLALRYAF